MHYFIFIVVFINGLVNCNNICSTTSGTDGTCIPLNVCKNIVTLLETVTYKERLSILKTIEATQCGFNGTIPNICCPNNVKRINEDKMKLLPEVCGGIYNDRLSRGNKTYPSDIPWMALITYMKNGKTYFRCVGTILNNKYILTAAHCITDMTYSTLYGVRVGEHDINSEIDCINSDECIDPPQNFNIEKFIVHPEYSVKSLQNDIALIRLNGRINFTDSVESVCLPLSENSKNANSTGEVMTSYGWDIQNASSSSLLQTDYPHLRIKNNDLCNNHYSKSLLSPLVNTQLCVENLKNECIVDVGGPLILLNDANDWKATQYGIISYGRIRCKAEDIPIVSIKLTEYIDWILNELQP